MRMLALWVLTILPCIGSLPNAAAAKADSIFGWPSEVLHARGLVLHVQLGGIGGNLSLGRSVSAAATAQLMSASSPGKENRSFDFGLEQPSPTPFVKSATIRYSLAEPVEVSLCIFDLSGRVVEKVFSGPMPAGRYELTWPSGSEEVHVGAGIYFCRLDAGAFHATQRLVLVR